MCFPVWRSGMKNWVSTIKRWFVVGVKVSGKVSFTS